ncbi:hypothetical protein SCP_1702030 [Sparassis crispa]|uniref:NADP-dependent oxidoreductase domain-containing protein n=1 Tax=Sparassis crispa TaxID=139825 RepID=A0A401H606_9APHY|nr:hypothetical protein SCP_1702030 [Sparassis crispa]GBE89877.1 hypothetical protein SCP_1702030 [Sparassis crispa]
MTKWGRYGPAQSEFDYTPATVRESVRRSLAQLNTDYLDVVYLHDVEYVCTPVGPQEAGDHTAALAEVRAAEYGLAWGAEGKVWGEGALKILDALAELRKMQGEGFIRAVGITVTALTRLHPPDAGLFSPVGDFGVLSTSRWTTLSHPAFPNYDTQVGPLRKIPPTRAYTGYIDIEARHLFFYFFESRNDPTNDDVIFWTNGGPGCSSSLGLFMELGQIDFSVVLVVTFMQNFRSGTHGRFIAAFFSGQAALQVYWIRQLFNLNGEGYRRLDVSPPNTSRALNKSMAETNCDEEAV